MGSNTPGGGAGGTGSGLIGAGGTGYTRTTHDVEEQNDQRLEGLLGKVKILKDVSRQVARSLSCCSSGIRVLDAMMEFSRIELMLDHHGHRE